MLYLQKGLKPMFLPLYRSFMPWPPLEMPVRTVAAAATVAMRTTRIEGRPSFSTSLVIAAAPMPADTRHDPAKIAANCRGHEAASQRMLNYRS